MVISFTDWVLQFQQEHQELLSEDDYDDVILDKANYIFMIGFFKY